MQTYTLPVGGITFAACAARVQKAISKREGVENVVVNFATERAAFSYDPDVVRLSTVKEAVVKAGYKILDAASADEDRARREKAIRTLWTKFIISAVFALPLLYIAMAPMIKLVRLPFPSALDPMHFPLTYAVVELILVIPCIAVGYKFYTVGFKALFLRSPNMDSLIAVGTTAAVVYSVWSTIQIAAGNFGAAHSLYYETAGVIITLILLGKSLEARAKGRTSEAIKSDGPAAQNGIVIGRRLRARNPHEMLKLTYSFVKTGQKFRLTRCGRRHSAVDESMLRARASPWIKRRATRSTPPRLNKRRAQVQAEKIGSDTALSDCKASRNAQSSKAPICGACDKVSGVSCR